MNIGFAWKTKGGNMGKNFYEYADINTYPTLNEVVYPHCPSGAWGDDSKVFLAYAENKEEAFKLAMAHIYDGRPLEKFYGTYAGEKILR